MKKGDRKAYRFHCVVRTSTYGGVIDCYYDSKSGCHNKSGPELLDLWTKIVERNIPFFRVPGSTYSSKIELGSWIVTEYHLTSIELITVSVVDLGPD